MAICSKKFDAVLVTNYLFRPKLAALFDLVGEGGYLAYETFAVGNAIFGRPKNPDFLLHEGELVDALPAGFDIIDTFHGFVSDPQPAVIQRLAARRIRPQPSNKQILSLAHHKWISRGCLLGNPN